MYLVRRYSVFCEEGAYLGWNTQKGDSILEAANPDFHWNRQASLTVLYPVHGLELLLRYHEEGEAFLLPWSEKSPSLPPSDLYVGQAWLVWSL